MPNPDNPLATQLKRIVQRLSEVPWGSVSAFDLGDWGIQMITYSTSEEGLDYADIELPLPPDFYAVIEGDTYGEMVAARVFRLDLPQKEEDKGNVLAFTKVC